VFKSNVEKQVELTNVAASLGHPDGALSRRDSIDVSHGPDAHGGSDSLAGLLADLDGPLHLFDVLEVLYLNGHGLSKVLVKSRYSEYAKTLRLK